MRDQSSASFCLNRMNEAQNNLAKEKSAALNDKLDLSIGHNDPTAGNWLQQYNKGQ